jgi:hypothetical protein
MVAAAPSVEPADRRGRLAAVLFGRSSAVTALYLVVGVAVAAGWDYFDRLGTVSRWLTAIAAVVLWPLVALGFDIRITR